MPEEGMAPSAAAGTAGQPRPLYRPTGDALRLGVLASGSGTNLQAIMDACAAGEIGAEVVLVVSDQADAFALQRARGSGIEAVHLDRTDYADARSYGETMTGLLLAHRVELVVMAGYMRLLHTAVLDAFPGAVLNVHPALLPSFPGAHGIADAFAHGVKVTGVTVHLANAVFDEGPIIAQEAVEVAEDDTVESLEAKIHAVEYRIYPRAIELYAAGRLAIEGRKIRVL
jgi:phosphoribosylglycinamide formyltransferase 1